MKHGLYCDVLPEAERETYDRIEIGSLEEEIRLTRVKLRTALTLQAQYEAARASNGDITLMRDKLEISEIVTTSSNGQAQQTAVKRVLRDYRREINNLTRLIADLEVRQITLGQARPGNADEIALKIRQALQQIDAANGVAAPEKPK